MSRDRSASVRGRRRRGGKRSAAPVGVGGDDVGGMERRRLRLRRRGGRGGGRGVGGDDGFAALAALGFGGVGMGVGLGLGWGGMGMSLGLGLGFEVGGSGHRRERGVGGWERREGGKDRDSSNSHHAAGSELSCRLSGCDGSC